MNWNKILIKDINNFEKIDNILIDKQSTNEIYDNIVEFYDTTRPLLPDSFFSILWEKGIIKKDTVLLDLACGTGRSSLKLVESYPINVLGVDISFLMLKKYLSKLDKINKAGELLLIKGEASSLPIKDNSINNCITLALFHLTENYKEIIENIKRVLKNNGKFITINPDLNSNLPTNDFTYKVWKTYNSLLEDEGIINPPHLGLSQKQLSEHLSKSFNVEEIRDKRLKFENNYSVKKMFFEIENQTDSNLVRANIDREINKKVIVKLHKKLREQFGDNYMNLSQTYCGEMIIKIATFV